MFCNQNRFEFQIPQTENIEHSFQGTNNFQILGNETLITADYKYAKIFKFAMLDIKSSLKDDKILYKFWAFV